jgi:hypothetical protein
MLTTLLSQVVLAEDHLITQVAVELVDFVLQLQQLAAVVR